MKVRELYIDGYGKYHQFHVREEQLSAPVTLFYGHNEAGKSTLHSFIRGMLFGFHIKGVPSYDAFQGGQVGGRLTFLLSSGERLQVHRKVPPKQGQVQVILEDGREENEAYLKEQLGQMTPQLYSNIFAFNHQQLQKIETLDDEEIIAYIYGAVTGTGNVNLLDFEKKMTRAQELLFKPRASNPEMNALIREMEERRSHIEQLKRKLEHYRPLQEEVKRLTNELEGLRRRREELERKKQGLEGMHRSILVQEELEQLQVQARSFQTPQLVPYEAKLHTLQMEKELVKDKTKELQKIAEQLRGIEREISRFLEDLGEEWTEISIIRFTLPLTKKDQLLQLASQKDSLTEKINKTSEQSQSSGKKTPLFLLLSLATISFPAALYQIGQAWVAGILFLFLLYMTIHERLKGYQTRENKQELMKLENEAARVEAAWQNELKKLGLPALISTATLVVMLRKIEELRHFLQQKEELLAKQNHHQRLINSWQEKVYALAEIRGLQTIGSSGDSLLELLLHQLHLEKEEAQQRNELTRQIKRLEAQYQQLLQKSDDGLEQEHKLEQEQEQDQKQVERFTREEYETRENRVIKEYELVLEQIEECSRELGKRTTELQDLECEKSLARYQQELEEQKAKYQELAKSWSVYSLAKHISAKTRKIFEEQRQPAILKEASSFLHQLTLGRYVQVILPLGGKEMLIAREDGERLEANKLSQGTVEQLYLAMRFAFIREHAKRVRLPIIMDDIFVNFDLERLDAALKVVQEMSSTHQVILFTCHRYLIEAMQSSFGHISPIYLSENQR